MTQKQIDQNTRLPDGNFGVDAYTAFSLVNENAADAERRLGALERGGVDPALVASLQAGLASIGGDNLLMNSSFEQGTGTNPPIGWSVGSQGLGAGIIGRMYVPSVLPDSARAWRWELNNVPVSGYLEGVTNSAVQLPRVEPGKPLNVSVSVRGTAGARWFLQVAWLDSNNTVISYQGTQGTQTLADELWSRKSLSIATAPSGAVSARVYLRIYGTNTSGQWVEWDNASLQIGSTATGYAPSVYEAINTALAAQSAASAADAKAVAADAKAASAGAAVDALSLRTLGRNLLINGDFRFWQRGVDFAAAAATRYTADRWFAWAGGSTMRVRQSDANIVALPPYLRHPPRYVLTVDVVSVAGANNLAMLQQRIEDVRTLSNGKAAFSGWIVSSVSGNIGVCIYQTFGTGGSGTIVGATQLVPLVANQWKYVTVILDLPAVAGKTIAGDSALWLNIFLDAGANSPSSAVGQKSGTYRFSQLQFESGATATTFDFRHDAVELALCQRYYQKSYALATAPGTPNADPGRVATGSQYPSAGAPMFSACPLRFNGPMRATPSVTIYAAVSGTAGKITMSDNSDVAGPVTVRGIAEPGCEVNWANNAGTFGGWFHFTADAEL